MLSWFVSPLSSIELILIASEVSSQKNHINGWLFWAEMCGLWRQSMWVRATADQYQRWQEYENDLKVIYFHGLFSQP